jgi:hypothetical protein
VLFASRERKKKKKIPFASRKRERKKNTKKKLGIQDEGVK